MNAAQMVEEKIVELTGTTKQLSPRNVSSFLESLAFQMERDDHKLARGLKAVNSFRIVENMESNRIMEVEQVKAMNLDPNSKRHDTRYDEFEQI